MSKEIEMNNTNMSLAEQLTQLMSNAPPRPDEAPQANVEFDAHASKVREVLTSWLTKPPGKEFDVEFLSALSQHWNHLNDSEYGDSLGMSFSSHQKLGAHISAYRFIRDRK